MSVIGHRSPRGPELLVMAVLPDAMHREAILGDLAEEYQHIASTQSVRAARRWYWSQVMRSVIPLGVMTMRARNTLEWLGFTGNVLVGLVAIGTLIPLSFAAVASVVAPAAGGEYIDGVLAIARSPVAVYSWWTCAFILAGVGTGYVLLRTGGTTGGASAIALGIVCIPLCVIVLAADGQGSPEWYEVALSTAIIPGIACGAMLALRRETRIGVHS